VGIGTRRRMPKEANNQLGFLQGNKIIRRMPNLIFQEPSNQDGKAPKYIDDWEYGV